MPQPDSNRKPAHASHLPMDPAHSCCPATETVSRGSWQEPHSLQWQAACRTLLCWHCLGRADHESGGCSPCDGSSALVREVACTLMLRSVALVLEHLGALQAEQEACATSLLACSSRHSSAECHPGLCLGGSGRFALSLISTACCMLFTQQVIYCAGSRWPP